VKEFKRTQNVINADHPMELQQQQQEQQVGRKTSGKLIVWTAREWEWEGERDIGERENDSRAHTHTKTWGNLSTSQIGISLHWSPLEPQTHTHMTVVSIREFVKMSTGETVCFVVWSLGVQSPVSRPGPDPGSQLVVAVVVFEPRSFCKTNH